MTVQRRCLVVDDSRLTRKILRDMLETIGFVVTEAADGHEALLACQAATPDCVLLDWNMPVMTGIEFLRILRQTSGPARPAVLFCTSETRMSFVQQAIADGAQEFIMKPFNADILTGKLAQIGLA